MTEVETTQSTTESTQAPVETTAPMEAAETHTDTASDTQEGTQAQTAPAWTPNFKFKVKDKELEFDDWIRPVVKNKETEEKLRDLYSKAHGIDEIKADRQSLKERYAQIEERTQKIDQSLKTLGEFVKKRDYRSFFESLRIPREQVIEYALQELKYLELPEEERNKIEQEREMQARLAQYEQQNHLLMQQQEDLVRQQVERELSFQLERPEVTEFSAAFDARMGKPGAFREEVLKRGAYYEAVHQMSPPAQQVVNEVMQLIGNSMASQGNGMSQQATTVQTPHTGGKKPVIPSFSGSGSTSPARKVPTSVADLKKLRQQLQQQG